VNSLGLAELLIDGEEIIRIQRRDRAYWTLWAIRGPRLKQVPSAPHELTGERGGRRRRKRTAPSTPQQREHWRAELDRARAARAAAGQLDRGDLHHAVVERFRAEFHSAREKDLHGENRTT
jgi:truncated hemoglobin YjbI